ncbi:hypothetical protein [Sphingosinicella sp.]|uniref:hypothetical protein n=1 Tax=Sphingosinicella sp. TaxID=1917971 RepID=UPI0035B3D4BD
MSRTDLPNSIALLLAAFLGGMACEAQAAQLGAIVIDGKPVRAAPLDVIRTPSGEWPIADLGRVAEGRAYLFSYRAKPDWYSLCIVRAPDGDGTIDERRYDVRVGGDEFAVTALPGSMKCADSGEPVAPTMARVVAAVRAQRVLPYAARAFEGFPPRRKPKNGAEDVYRPDRIYGRSSANNAIGTVSGQAGEAGSSRGFLSETDARVIAAAFDRDGKAFAAAARRARVETLYGLSLPNLVIWSDRHHQMRDPQVPLPGDRPYTNEGSVSGGDDYGDEGKWTAPQNYQWLGEIGAEAGKTYVHRRDEAHLFNHGYAYWLATGDPRAAILQQAIMAYALASNYRRSAGRYVPRFTYQRTTLNQFSAMWKLRDVAANVSSGRGNIFWPKARAEKMNADLWAGWKMQLARMDVGRDVHARASSIFRGIDRDEDNAYSNFMIQAYGPEAAYLWASAGEPALMRRIAENFVLRFGDIGGAQGFYGAGKGSGFPLISNGKLPYQDRKSLIAWVASTSPHPTDSFEGAPAHYVLRGYWSLRLAADAARRGWLPPVSGLDEAVKRTERARDRTGKWKYAGLASMKHAGVPFAD